MAVIAKATLMCQTLHKVRCSRIAVPEIDMAKKRQFTNTGNFTLRCGICQEGFTGEKAAIEVRRFRSVQIRSTLMCVCVSQHAQKTGHTNFAEFK